MLLGGIAKGQWQQLIGPGLNTSSIAIKDSIVFVGTWHSCGTNAHPQRCGQLYISTDNGNNWTSSIFNYDDVVFAIAIKENNVFIGTNSGVYKSTNYGNSWLSVNSGLTNLVVNALAINGNNIYAGTNNGLYLSSNNGNSWSMLNTGMLNSHVKAIAFNGNNIFAGTDSGIFLSTNYGNSWNIMNNGLTDTNIKALTINGTNIFAGTCDDGVFLSTDNGNSWTAVNNGLPLNKNIWSLSKSGNNIFAGCYGTGIYWSKNNGNNWELVKNGMPSRILITTIFVNDSNIFAGSENNVGIHKRSLSDLLLKPVDADTISGPQIVYKGQTPITYTIPPILNAASYVWTLPSGASGNSDSNSINVIFGANSTTDYISVYGLNSLGKGDSSILKINVNPLWHQTNLNNETIYSFAKNGNDVFAGGWNGIYKSTNNGNTWTSVFNLPSQTYAISALAIQGNTIYAGSGNGMYISTDYGANWIKSDSGITYNHILSIAISGNNIFAGTYSNGIYKSTDNGISWVQMNNGLTCPYVYSLAVKGNLIFAGTTSQGVFISSDNGNSWIEVNNGLQTGIGVYSLLLINNNLYAGTTAGVFMTTNNGDYWSSINNGLISYPCYCAMSAINDSVLFAASYDLFMTSDYGSNWVKINDNFRDFNGYDIIVSENNLLAGTDNGIWKLSLSDTITTNVNPIMSGICSGDGLYSFMQTCSISAISTSGYKFINWTENGNIVCLDSTYTFIVVENRNLIANFSLIQGINEKFNQNNINIYPNPATNTLSLNLSQLQKLQNITVSIYDIQGKQLLFKNITEKQSEIDISAFAKGIYIIKVQSDKEILQSKFVKE